MGIINAVFNRKGKGQSAAENRLHPELPTHIAIIMDGNGRWAKKRFMSRSYGHYKGAQRFREIATYANQIGIKYLTVYAFSTENWKRSPEEVAAIMDLLRDYLHQAQEELLKENMVLRFIGDTAPLSADIRELIDSVTEISRNADGTVLTIALNYGSRAEIVRGVKDIARRAALGEIDIDSIDETVFANSLYTADMPDPDLIIRPSGEYRLSNFLLWQAAYSEMLFLDVLWPDFDARELDKAIIAYQGRNRRFGGVTSK
jgi:undecaprenyl diphosphate synthase